MYTHNTTLPPLTKKQQEILLLLYRFRFFNRIHVQTLLNHKDYHRINIWLKDLTQKEYTGRIYSNKLKENTIPAKYYLKINGIRYLKTRRECHKQYFNKLYAEDKKSESFIDKCLFIADIYLHYLKDSSTDATAQSFYTQSDYTPTSIIRDINPDFVILTGKEDTQHFALYQLFPEGIPRYAVRKRIEQCITFLTEGEGSDLPASLSLIIQSEALYKYLTRHIQKLLEDESINVPIHLATYDQVVEHGIAQSTFKDAAETVDE